MQDYCSFFKNKKNPVTFQNFDYELVEGCSRQEKRYDPSEVDQLGAVDRTFNQKLAADAMFKAEHEEQVRDLLNMEFF